MGKFFEEIPANLLEWIQQQEMFWVATAPLATDGHVNVSPKGLRGTFRVESPTKVWYEDMTGSGSETIAHLKENGRITILFVAFEGPPRIVRLFGHGTVHQFGTPEYDQFLPGQAREAGSRAVIVIEVHKVGTSCGFSVPYYKFDKHRTQLTRLSAMLESRDHAYEVDHPSEDRSQSHHSAGLRMFWKNYNHSIDGLPSLDSCISAPRQLGVHQPPPSQPASFRPQLASSQPKKRTSEIFSDSRIALLVGIVIGLAVSGIISHFTAGNWKSSPLAFFARL